MGDGKVRGEDGNRSVDVGVKKQVGSRRRWMGTWAMDGRGYGHAAGNDKTVMKSMPTKENIRN